MKRVNVKLLAWMLTTTLATVVGVHFLHGYQMKRNAGVLLDQAESAKQTGNVTEAAKQFAQYLKYRPKDRDVNIELADLMVSIAERPGHTRRDIADAWRTLETTVRMYPDQSKLRRRIVDYAMQYNRPLDAMKHIELLLDTDQADALLEVKRAQCLIALGNEREAKKLLADLVGFDLSLGKFDASKTAVAPHEVDAYLLLARILYHDNRPAADSIVNQMVDINKESHRAYLERARYRLQGKARDEARADLDKALEIAPDDADVIVFQAQMLVPDGKYAEARALLERGIKKHPKNEVLYNALAMVVSGETKNTDEAIKILNEGLKELPESQGLLRTYADMLMSREDIEGVRQTLQKMEKEGSMPEWIAYFRARIAFHDKQWLAAARQFERLRPVMARSREMVIRIDLFLAECYEHLGEPDRAGVAAKRVLDLDPNNVMAKFANARSLFAVGKPGEARDVIKTTAEAREKKDDPNVEGDTQSTNLQELADKESKKPKEQRDWTEVDAATKEVLAKSKRLSDVQKEVLQIDIMALKEDFKGAVNAVKAALKTHPEDISLWITYLTIAERTPVAPLKTKETTAEKEKRTFEEKRKRVFAILNSADKAAGDKVALRVQRAQMIVRYAKKAEKGSDDEGVAKSQVAAELAKLEQGIDDSKKFSTDEQIAFWSAQGMAFYRSRDYDNARRCWLVVATMRPDDVTIRETLFNLAVEFYKQKDIETGIAEIRKMVGSDDSLYLFCLAAKSIAKIQHELHGKRGMEQAESLEIGQARAGLREAQRLRPTWYQLAQLNGTLDDLEGNYEQALQDYRSSLQLGPANPAASRRIVQLLWLLGRNDEAKEAMEAIGELAPGDPLGIITIREGLATHTEEGSRKALEAARKIVENDPSEQNHVMLAQVYSMMTPPRPDDAEAELRLVLKMAPESPEPWILLLTLLKEQSKGAEAREVIAKAREELPEKLKPAVLGPAYELTGDFKGAENQFLEVAKQHPDSLLPLRALATFYSRAQDHEQRMAVADPKAAVAHQQQATEYREKAVANMDKILGAKTAGDDVQSLIWARRAKAQVLARMSGYQNLQAALQLVDQNASGGSLSPEDMRLEADLLAGRADFESRNRAIKIYEEIGKSKGTRLKPKKSQLTANEQIVLADLYDRMGRWKDARDTMEALIAKDKKNPRYMSILIRMFVAHNELDKAKRWFAELDSVNKATLQRAEAMGDKNARDAELAKHASTFATTNELQALWLAKNGQKKEAEAVVDSYMKESEPTADGLEKTAVVLESMGLDEAAAKRFRAAAELQPKKGLALAAFLGRHEGYDLDEAFALYEDAAKSWPFNDIASAALSSLEARKTEATPKQFKTVLNLIEKGLAENDGHSNELQVQKCQWLELQGRYAEVIPLYRAILKNPKFDRAQQAGVKNNLSYLLATGNPKPEDAKEALKLINETIAELGPTADVLDTRAVAYIANEQYGEAVKDAKASLLENPTALKSFHLALALYRDGKNAEAHEALADAQDRKIETQIVPNERAAYNELVKELPNKKK